ncbi:MAG: ATP-binding protein [Verrucomicrobia bacterium]|nr:ATP-binding protein [Verrucomicrobiota bacterium]MDA1066335.1 ATP-binding protein [Verrucomicrobiota bacterium]
MIIREKALNSLSGLLERHRIVGLIGARQVGKTTLARDYVSTQSSPVHFFDLENPEDEARLSDPMLALKNLEGLVVIDEVQRIPNIFPVLRVLADRKPNPAKFLILGSASPALLKQSSESLAGRIFYNELGGFSLDEIGSSNGEKLWLRGGMPESFLASSERQSFEYRLGYTRTFLEQDLPQLGISVSSTTMRRFWTMLAHYHGQTWNASELGRSFGVADTTVRTYLDHLTSALVVRQLQPWHENISKRQVKAPKVYIEDSGVLHALLNLPELKDLESHPKLGASWEGFVLNQIIHQLDVRSDECYFWATYSGAELDLLVVRGSQRLGFEIKRTSAPKITLSMRSALQDLKLTQLSIIHAGEHSFDLDENIRAIALERLLSDLQPI